VAITQSSLAHVHDLAPPWRVHRLSVLDYEPPLMIPKVVCFVFDIVCETYKIPRKLIDLQRTKGSGPHVFDKYVRSAGFVGIN
jgi:hypothetical protein